MLNILENEIRVAWVKHSRKMRLLETYYYDDPKGVRWIAEKGEEIDGSSKPKFTWSIAGGPFTGEDRGASVMHDVYCKNRERPHEQTHDMFWDLMMAMGCDEDFADRRWFAVYHFGPKWDDIGKDTGKTKEEKAFMASVGEEY